MCNDFIGHYWEWVSKSVTTYANMVLRLVQIVELIMLLHDYID